jgi:hypothetical protein
MKPTTASLAVTNIESDIAAGRLDLQLTELIEFVRACETAAAKADRIEAAVRWIGASNCN